MPDKPLPQTTELRIKELEQQLVQVQQKADFRSPKQSYRITSQGLAVLKQKK